MENLPATQSAHPPVLDMYFPAAHDVVEPVVLQSAWDVEPAWDDVVGEGHIMQASSRVCCSWLLNLPAGQLVQALASTLAENFPLPHERHPPVLDLYFPAVHDVVEPVVLQSASEVEPAWDDVPEGHILHRGGAVAASVAVP